MGEKPSGINPVKKQIDINLRIFPNPVKSSATIDFTISKKVFTDISIYNLHGEKISQLAKKSFPQGNHKLQWDASTFPLGIYFCKLETENQVQVRKIIISR